MRIHPNADWRGYLALLCGSSALTIGAVATLNYQVDPYLTHQWDTPQVLRLRPAREKLSPWGKTYALAKFKPGVVYIGNSRTELGLPTEMPEFAGKSVFNSGLSGASLGDTVDMVRHAANVSQLDTLVWGIDAPSFSMELGNKDFDRDLVADGPFYLWRRSLINLKRALTVDMTVDSIKLLLGKFDHTCRSSLALGGQRDHVCVHDRIDGWGGTKAAIVPRTREFIRGAGPTAEAELALDRSVGNLCRSGTRIRLYINPTHAMMADALYWAGKSPQLEAWQGWLAQMAQRYRTQRCDVRVVDFSGFNSITNEPIPQVSLQNEMLNYWETSHYRDNVGRMILARMFGPADSAVPDDFGVELTPAGMPQHVAQQRLARDRYHVEHPGETALAKAVVAERLSDTPHEAAALAAPAAAVVAQQPSSQR